MDFNKIALFQGLAPQEIERVHAQCTRVSLDAGAVLFEEGKPGDALYIVERGTITIAKRVREDSESTIPILTVDPAGFFGELAILADAPRISSAVAAEASTLFRLSKDHVLALVRDEPAIGATLLLNLARTIAGRAQLVNQELALLFELGRILASGFEDVDRALPDALKILAQGLHAERACFFGVNTANDSIDLIASLGCRPGPLSLSLRRPSGRLAALPHITTPRILDDRTLTELSGSDEAQAWEAESTMILPIRGAEATAAYLVLSRSASPFSSHELNLAQSASLQLGQFTERARLQQDVQLQRDIKREYFKI